MAVPVVDYSNSSKAVATENTEDTEDTEKTEIIIFDSIEIDSRFLISTL
jgi:hypothetical protein